MVINNIESWQQCLDRKYAMSFGTEKKCDSVSIIKKYGIDLWNKNLRNKTTRKKILIDFMKVKHETFQV